MQVQIEAVYENDRFPLAAFNEMCPPAGKVDKLALRIPLSPVIKWLAVPCYEFGNQSLPSELG